MLPEVKYEIGPNILLQRGEKWVGIATYTSLSKAPDHPARLARRVFNGGEGPRVPPLCGLGHHEPCLLTRLRIPLFQRKYSINHCIRAQQIHWTHCEIFLFIFLNFSFVPEFSGPNTVHVNHMLQLLGTRGKNILALYHFQLLVVVVLFFYFNKF